MIRGTGLGATAGRGYTDNRPDRKPRRASLLRDSIRDGERVTARECVLPAGSSHVYQVGKRRVVRVVLR
ncbi:MAG: hypothetical protein MUC77_21505, partial [Chromatiaceae bacterium]|nr:hypothetical protein [Chromatiaceae bacterium]